MLPSASVPGFEPDEVELNALFSSNLAERNDPFKSIMTAVTSDPRASNPPRPRGRQAQAARNDELILRAAREVFLADPEAPVAAVAARAGVGIGALYHRYASKEDLLRTLCHNGQQIYLAEVRRALSSGDDPWQAYTSFLRAIVAANTHGLTVRLAGTFEPTADQMALAEQMHALGTELFQRAQDSGQLRPGITWLDVEYLLELLARGQAADAERAAGLRQRQLTVIIDGLRYTDPTPLPGDPPAWGEQTERWVPAHRAGHARKDPHP
jgi:AcrR family transcriptional regulator